MHERRAVFRTLLSCAVIASVTSGLAAASPRDAWAAEGETCHGQAATIVGEPGSDVEGTDGPDIVLSNGAETVYTGLGDDLVCLTHGTRRRDVKVDPGGGDDVVDGSESTAERVSAFLGPGDDTYTGGPGEDYVEASDPWEGPSGDGADTVVTGGGRDIVVTGGPPSSPDHDAVDLGAGRDDAWINGVVDPAFPVAGGGGSDQLELSRSTLRQALVLDNATGRATDAGDPVMTWSGMERFRITPSGAFEAPSFIGGAGSERVWTSVPLSSVDLGGGDDLVNLEVHGSMVDNAAYVGGSGEDAFILYAGAGDQARQVDLDLPEHTLLFRRVRQTVHARIEGFERHRFSARQIDVRGTAAADHVRWSGCRGVVAGRAGDDVLKVISVDDAGCGDNGEDADLVVRGGRGDDRLIGNSFPDILLGGWGNDWANGGDNTDRCRAERRISCER